MATAVIVFLYLMGAALMNQVLHAAEIHGDIVDFDSRGQRIAVYLLMLIFWPLCTILLVIPWKTGK